MSRLFVRRDPLLLVPALGGIVTEYGKLPDFLKTQPRIAHSSFLQNVSAGDIRTLKLKESDQLFEKKTSWKPLAQSLPAVWSGYRSCLTQDEKTGELYRLKGAAFVQDENGRITVERGDDHSRILGGQSLKNAEYERDYSEKFNKTLRSRGIAPVMQYEGLYEYPSVLVDGKQIATSIVSVKGDTRLDELFYMLEKIHDRFHNYYHADKDKFRKHAHMLYTDFGKIVGGLKKLMDQNGQTWSDNPQRTNAHIGNVVVYQQAEKIALGLVDFDASCDSKDKSWFALRKQRKAEYETIINSAFCGGVSFRQIGRYFDRDFLIQELRKSFTEGFIKGHSTGLNSESMNLVELARIEELLALLPEQPAEERVHRMASSYTKNLYKSLISYDNQYSKSDDGIENILDLNSKYQKSINKKPEIDSSYYGIDSKKINKYKSSLDKYLNPYRL